MSEQATQLVETPMPKFGTFCWMELASTNAEAAKTFYADLFGWKLEKNTSVPDMDYTEFGVGETEKLGGIMQMTKEFGDMPSHWMNYVAVENVDESAEKVTQLGGKVCVPPTDIPNVGRFCVINDPTGATLSLLTLNSM